MTAPTFDTHAGVRKLLSSGMDEQVPENVVEVVGDATSPLLTRDVLRTELAVAESRLRADMYRALWLQGAGIVAVVAGIVAILEAMA